MHRPRHDSEVRSYISLGILASQFDREERMGHVWIHWSASQTSLQEFRGYWPHPDDYAHIPPGERREHFYNNSARGLVTVDYRAKELMRRYKSQCRHASWRLDELEIIRLEFLCWIPPQCDSREDGGRYSCSLSHPEWHNCSSWVKATLDRIGGRDAFFSCDEPKRLKLVVKALWGDAQ